MTSSETLELRPPVQQDGLLHAIKRNRMCLKKEFPISKLLGKDDALDYEYVIDLFISHAG
jgi:hypothetical protein